MSNACAHYLHNMLYVLGERLDHSARPVTVTAELYRAHPIENYDTGALRCLTDTGVEILFMVSHATRRELGPLFEYEFENATISYAEPSPGQIIARFKDGSVRNYGVPVSASEPAKLWETIASLRSRTPVACGIEASAAQTQVVCAAQQSVSDIAEFPASMVHVQGEPGARKRWVRGMDDVLFRCYQQGLLPSELKDKPAWSVPGTPAPITEWNNPVVERTAVASARTAPRE